MEAKIVASLVLVFSALALTVWLIILDASWRAPRLGLRPDANELSKVPVTCHETVEFLLGEIRSQLERRTATVARIDAQVAQFLTIIGGGTGVVALLSANAHITAKTSPLLSAAAITLFMVLVNCVVSAIPRRRQASELRDIDSYNIPAFLNDPSNEARLAHELIVRYANLSNSVMIQAQKKRRYFLAAASLFVMSIGLVLASVLLT